MMYYVALPFSRVDGGLAPGEAAECPNAGAAIRRAQAMASNQANAGAVAFSRSGDPNLGEFEDAVILKAFGDVPEDSGKHKRRDLPQGRAVARNGRSRLAAPGRTSGQCVRRRRVQGDSRFLQRPVHLPARSCRFSRRAMVQRLLFRRSRRRGEIHEAVRRREIRSEATRERSELGTLEEIAQAAGSPGSPAP